MPRDPVVSVLIPSFNRAHLIERTVDSVLQQSYPHCHAIVVDDGSSDGTARTVADRYGGNDRVQYLYKANGGPSSARNLGLVRAKGDCIAYLDSDDYWYPWKLSLQVACLNRLAARGVEMVWTNMNSVDAEGRLLEPMSMRRAFSAYERCRGHGVPVFERDIALAELLPGSEDPGTDTQVYWGDVFPAMAAGNLAQTSTLLLTRERALAAGPFNETLRVGEDHAYNLRATRLGPAALVDVAAVDYRKGAEDQLTAQAHKLSIALAHLRTVSAVFQSQRKRLRLPASLVEATLADAHAWIAEEMMQQGDHRGARVHLARSLRMQPWRSAELARLVMSFVPPAALGALRQAYRGVKRRAKGRASSASPDTRKCPPAT